MVKSLLCDPYRSRVRVVEAATSACIRVGCLYHFPWDEALNQQGRI